mmetsp:Transcript_5397/g.10118  ORF Transcript_5397/g.10118 Transcript_5397/m.10118 type:complete len:207 (-) Transcript_5397:162-782(-)
MVRLQGLRPRASQQRGAGPLQLCGLNGVWHGTVVQEEVPRLARFAASPTWHAATRPTRHAAPWRTSRNGRTSRHAASRNGGATLPNGTSRNGGAFRTTGWPSGHAATWHAAAHAWDASLPNGTAGYATFPGDAAISGRNAAAWHDALSGWGTAARRWRRWRRPWQRKPPWLPGWPEGSESLGSHARPWCRAAVGGCERRERQCVRW